MAKFWEGIKRLIISTGNGKVKAQPTKRLRIWVGIALDHSNKIILKIVGDLKRLKNKWVRKLILKKLKDKRTSNIFPCHKKIHAKTKLSNYYGNLRKFSVEIVANWVSDCDKHDKHSLKLAQQKKIANKNFHNKTRDSRRKSQQKTFAKFAHKIINA